MLAVPQRTLKIPMTSRIRGILTVDRLVVFKHLAEQFLDARARRDESLPPGGRRAIYASAPSAIQHGPRPQIAVALHSMKNRVERAGAQPVPVAAELVDHRLAEDWTFRGVVKDMEPNQPRVELSIIHRGSISSLDRKSRV